MGSPTAIEVDRTSGYRLSDEVARLCLPQNFKDFCRNLAWANSVCALFLAVALVGLKVPPVYVRAVASPVDSPNLEVFTLPQPLEPVELKTSPLELGPQTAPESLRPPLAVIDTTPVKFPAPFDGVGPVTILPTGEVPFPGDAVDRWPQAPTRIPKFTPDASDTEGGYYPKPDYPLLARKGNQQGTCKVEVLVEASGAVASVKVLQSSGYSILDAAAVDVVKKRWRFPAGSARHFWYPFIFEISR